MGNEKHDQIRYTVRIRLDIPGTVIVEPGTNMATTDL